jgi:creatinine amidohydrolase
MTDLHSRLLTDLAPPDIREYLSTDDTILMPMGAVEMHGDHLPIGTDIYNAMEVSKRAAEKAGVLYGPPIWSGYSPHHLREPERGMGTLTFRGETLRAILHDTARSLIHLDLPRRDPAGHPARHGTFIDPPRVQPHHFRQRPHFEHQSHR